MSLADTDQPAKLQMPDEERSAFGLGHEDARRGIENNPFPEFSQRRFWYWEGQNRRRMDESMAARKKG